MALYACYFFLNEALPPNFFLNFTYSTITEKGPHNFRILLKNLMNSLHFWELKFINIAVLVLYIHYIKHFDC